MKKLYPLKFRPVWKAKAWGGEFWDLCGFEEESSVITEGHLAGDSLIDILETYLGDLVGDKIFDWYNIHFPLLIKRLDVQDRLSIQVHPDDTVAAERFDMYGKSEFWYVTEAGPEARIYMGFKENTDAGVLYQACKEGRVEQLLNIYVPRPGDCFFIPAGTVHAAGGGLKITEIQEPSDITFRLYDWGRENDPATRREIHLDEALDCIDYRKYDEAANYCRIDETADGVRVLVNVPQFVITSLVLNAPARIPIDLFKSCVVLVCLSGCAAIETAGTDGSLRKDATALNRLPLSAGETMLIPASLDELLLTPLSGDGTFANGRACTRLLQVHLPQPSSEERCDGPEPERQVTGAKA